MLELLTREGARRSVIVTGATTIRQNGGGARPSGIAPYDLVKVEGTVNSDGSVAATRIDVELAAAAAAQVSGDVARSFGEIQGLVVGDIMVVVSGETTFIRGIGPAAFKQLAPGQPVTVYGIPISIGSTPVGLRARLVVVR